jgi:hypothetical protein
MMGSSVAMTGAGVLVPKKIFESKTLKAGSKVFTVCVREIATAANDRLAATCPMACIDAGRNRLTNSSLLIGWEHVDRNPSVNHVQTQARITF